MDGNITVLAYDGVVTADVEREGVPCVDERIVAIVGGIEAVKADGGAAGVIIA